jgi:heat shock transcription factor, other eukaryote
MKIQEAACLITTKQIYRSVPVFSLPLNPIAKLCETHSFTCFVNFELELLTMFGTCKWLQGFRKVDPDRWEFANEGFLRGQRHLLKLIRRRRPPTYLAASQHQQRLGTYLEVGHLGLDEEIDLLKHDKNVLLAEVVKLQQEQQSTKAGMRAMEERLQRAERRQVQMMGFLARAMQNPDFFQQLLAQHQGMRRELEDAFSKKRRRPIDIVPLAFGGAAGRSSTLRSSSGGAAGSSRS